jgi:branched-chain amino acid transport system substrate-binding protein
VETLKQAGPKLTRAGLLQAAQHLDLKSNPFLLPGITIRTSQTNYFPLANVYLYRYDNAQWVRASALQPAR